MGNDPKSDSKLFYVSHTKSIIRLVDKDLEPSHPSCLVFGLTYNGRIQFSLLSPNTQEWRSPTYNQGEKVKLYNSQHKIQEATIINIPIKSCNYYAIRYTVSGDYD